MNSCLLSEIMRTNSARPIFFKNVHEVKEFISPLRAEGKTLVTTNGCFDILHAGHVCYLSEAASMGDLLVVGINSDNSVSELKGPDRPLQKENDRAFLMASLKMVDCAFIFTEKDPCSFLEILKPEIHVKGGDYDPEKLPEKAVVERNGGKIVVVSFLKGYSTSQIVNKIQNR
jgi:rfaE bifunctional protein nucleotidyltransferase chain/domain